MRTFPSVWIRKVFAHSNLLSWKFSLFLLLKYRLESQMPGLPAPLSLRLLLIFMTSRENERKWALPGLYLVFYVSVTKESVWYIIQTICILCLYYKFWYKLILINIGSLVSCLIGTTLKLIFSLAVKKIFLSKIAYKKQQK